MLEAIEAEKRRKADESPSLVDLTEAAIAADRKAEDAERRKQREERLRTYRGILSRRNKPGEQDAAQLAYVSRELGYDADRIRTDIKVLDQYDRLLSLASQVDKAQSDRDRLEVEVTKAKKAVDELKQAEREFGRAKDFCRTCSRAGNEARRLREAHSDLFEAE